ncbi:hypothetical protein NL676_009345 [Syzygium grande]|nr:hypothetical protein NL676_009345 [Syzygium grande]
MDRPGPPPGGAPPPASGAPPPPGGASPSAGLPSPGGAPPGASPPAGPPPAGSAPPPAVDALVPSGKERSELESSSTPLSSSGFKRDVFLNFRGSDTRKGITDQLCSMLTDAGITFFRDDENLYAGEEIEPKIKEAIQQSRISIAIFSKDYASSKSCLMELIEMWECRESKGQTIIPIFYDVSPMDVKRQAGDFERSFNLHEMDGVNSNTIKKWKEVLRKIGGLTGFERENTNGGCESQLVQKVVAREAPEDVSEYDSLSKDIVKAIGGLPLDVARHASFLRGKRDIVHISRFKYFIRLNVYTFLKSKFLDCIAVRSSTGPRHI